MLDNFELVINQIKSYNCEDADYISCIAASPYKKGTELIEYFSRLNILSGIIQSICLKMNSIKSHEDFRIKGIDYQILETERRGELPIIGSLCYSNNNTGNLSIQSIVVSKNKKNSLGSLKITSDLRRSLSEDIGYITTEEGVNTDFINDLFREYSSNIFYKVNTNHCFVKDDSRWELIDNGFLKLSLDKVLMCSKESFNSEVHTASLSSLNISKPWSYIPNANCNKNNCDSPLILSPAFLYYKKKDPNERITDPILISFAMASDLGLYISKFVSLIMFKEVKESKLFENLLLMPKTIYYEQKGVDYKLNFNKISDIQFKRSLGRDVNNHVVYTIFKKE